jgi:hypothetical protein
MAENHSRAAARVKERNVYGPGNNFAATPSPAARGGFKSFYDTVTTAVLPLAASVADGS